ncbi:MAG: RsmD family RNA methyltransferase, partial [Bacteroidales bacterium]|nr:RsmD family RNA methyltransferase [Bacteroidales bacterium]
MRIIAGTLKGKNIPIPENYKARPTTDFAREGLFNILDNEYEFEDLAILDLFAGTGAISYEFISRGAGSSICVEIKPENAAFISRTAAEIGIASRLSVVRHNVFEFLPLCTKKFDIVFADPPYALEGLDTLPDKVFEA